tara:strand:+ start:198 stop:773 length:576 start_codon:yes stop_codon:yes gene_type:complete
MWLICGLGNPDKKYNHTRHNLGYDVIESLISLNEFNLIKKDKSKNLYKGKINTEECLICKPLKYMNLSGPVIAEIIKFYKINIKQIIIIHDDLDLEIGKIKIKVGGSNAGHNGLSSIDECIGNNYKRIRFGIGHPGYKDLVSKYVLEKFSIKERVIVNYRIKILTKYFSLIFKDDGLLLTKIASEGEYNGL